MTVDQSRFAFPEPNQAPRRRLPVGEEARVICVRCHLPLDYDLRVAPGLIVLNRSPGEDLLDTDMCDTCRLEYFGEGVGRYKNGIVRWSGARLALARRRCEIDARELGRWIKVAHTTVIRNERREAITAYVTRRLVAWSVYDRLARATWECRGGAGPHIDGVPFDLEKEPPLNRGE